MNYKRTLVVAICTVFISYSSIAQKNNEQQMEKQANTLFKAGDYLQAYPLYSQLLALYPSHAEYNYKFGACAIYSDPDKTKAVKFLTIATNKALDDPMAWYYLGKAYHLNYQFKEAITSYEKFLSKADSKVVAKTDAQRSIETCIYGSNLLANIKDLEVISKKDADKNNFFRYFDLDEVGGKILTVPDELKSPMDKKSKEASVMHYPGTGTTIYFSSYGKDGSMGKDIYRATVLPNGKFSTPEKIKGDVNSKYDEDYCFMHSDGKTLYFSSKGHNSMGGYDIFKSIYDPSTDSFGPAINLDFAINTPDDDIFYMTDSLNQRAYFASGRSSDMNHLSVYNVLVQGNPLQVVYLKGEFFSEINNDQKKASFKIIDPDNNRIVCEGNTNSSNGNYVLYVPRSGDYIFKVVTENSPTVHEVKVSVPVYDRPVALRQEMRLISENGNEKITFRNHFDQPLDEDISSLAAEMLRKKAGLEVNVTEEELSSISSDNSTAAANAHALEPTLSNAPLAAGFAEGVTIGSIISGMENQLSQIRTFVAESDQKYLNGYAYALKKQNEANRALEKAESIRKSINGYAGSEDIMKLREAYIYTSEAETLQKEAFAAMNAAESVKQYKNSEAERAEKLEEQVRTIKQSESTNNFDAAVASLKQEKSRINTQADNKDASPFSELISKAKAKDIELQGAEKRLADMRTREKSLESSVKTSQSKLNSATKKGEREAAEKEYLAVKFELDALRRDIAKQNEQIKKLGSESKLAHANVEIYKRLASDTGMGLTAAERRDLTDAEKTTLTMKLNQMSNRISALDITDPQTLAMVTDASMDQQNRVSTTVIASNGTLTMKATNNATSVHEPTLSTTKPEYIAAISLKDSKDKALQNTAKTPANTATRRMYIAGSMEQVNSQIITLELKKRQGTFTVTDNKELAELVNLRSELQQELTQEKSSPTILSAQEMSTTVASYVPNYVNEMNVISARTTSEVDRIAQKQEYKNTVISQLKDARVANALAAMNETDANAIASHTQRDKQLESTITQLEKETNGIQHFVSAFEKEQNQINSSNGPTVGKAQRHVTASTNYIAVLEKMEKAKEQELELTNDLNAANDIRLELGEIKIEKEKANSQFNQYQQELLATKNSKSAEAKSTSVGQRTLEDELEESISTASNTAQVKSYEIQTEEEVVAEDAKTAEKIFKVRVESESIFAYESGIFEEVVTKNQSPENTLKNREKIADLNNQIFLIEGEMENLTNERKLRKLDYQAEQMYLKRSLMEIENSPAIARMAAMEYESESAKAKEMTQANREKIDSRLMIREDVARLEKEAAQNMEVATEMREASPMLQDDIERADNDRQAFAKEALAIEQMRQIQQINANIDMLLEYSDENLAELKTGTIPKEFREPEATLADNTSVNKEETATGAISLHESKTTGNSTVLETAQNGAMANTTATQTSGLAANQDADTKTVSTQSSASTANNNTKNVAVTSTISNTAETATTASAASHTTSTANAPSGNNTVTTTEQTQNKSQNTTDFAYTAPSTVPTSKVTPAANTTSSTTGVATTGNRANASTTVAVAPTNSTGAMADANFYFSAPQALTNDIFTRTTRGVYNMSQPIPIDMEMPQGVYYKVQVGAFRNTIPQNLYDEFAPICGEKLANGITRYSAGFFMTFENADNIKREIRAIGYGDAFVVAFRDGKRIPLYEAMGITEGQNMMASVEKEYIHGDKGEAPKSTMASSSKSTTPSNTTVPQEQSNKSKAPKSNNNTNGNGNSNSTSSNGAIIYTANNTGNSAVSDYYAGFADAAKASKVEMMQGLFYTVQVGVYSRPVPAKSMHYINPLNSELTDTRKIRYSSGIYTTMEDAVEKRAEARVLGISDAFITAYFNGQRITLSEADRLLKEKGPGILVTKGMN